MLFTSVLYRIHMQCLAQCLIRRRCLPHLFDEQSFAFPHGAPFSVSLPRILSIPTAFSFSSVRLYFPSSRLLGSSVAIISIHPTVLQSWYHYLHLKDEKPLLTPELLGISIWDPSEEIQLRLWELLFYAEN